LERAWLFALLALLFLVQVIRARQKSRALVDQFVDAYRQYRAQT